MEEKELMSYSIVDLVDDAYFHGICVGSSHENNDHYTETEHRIRFRAIMNEAQRRDREANKTTEKENKYAIES